MNLPEKYILTMKEFLGEDYPAWQDSFLALPEHGIRINELKTDLHSFNKLWASGNTDTSETDAPEPVEWIHNGLHIRDTAVFSMHPYYQAGLYYIQEPSAMTPAELLPIEPGDRILDLCAAPGGKSTELLSKLAGTGLLYANDISVSRAQALRKNIEIAGATNAYITAEDPRKLASVFPHFFDKILVDAPCSGEGMFRRKPDMVSEWIKKGPDHYAPVQSDILESAVSMLRPGGMLIYSTCTFSEIENEGRILKLLADHRELQPAELPDFPGFLRSRTDSLEKCSIRIMPHRMRGEGQFVCLLKKTPDFSERKDHEKNAVKKIYSVNDRLYLLPCGHLPVPGIRYLMTGLHVGTLKSGKLNPTQALAQALSARNWPRTLNLPAGDTRLVRYLRGESIEIGKDEISLKEESFNELFGLRLDQYSIIPSENKPTSGKKNRSEKYCKNIYTDHSRGKSNGNKSVELANLYTDDILVLADGFPVGFAAENRFLLKNKRNPGWRIH